MRIICILPLFGLLPSISNPLKLIMRLKRQFVNICKFDPETDKPFNSQITIKQFRLAIPFLPASVAVQLRRDV